MRESTTYQAILEEGRLEEVWEDIRLLGEQKFKTPLLAHVQTTLAGIPDPQQLKCVLKRILDVGGWDELVAAPVDRTPPRKKRK